MFHIGPGRRIGETEAPRFQDNPHMKVVRLSALRTAAFTHQEITLVLISVKVLRQQQGPQCGRKDYVNEKFQ